MQPVNEHISQLYQSRFGKEPLSVSKIPQSGSDRIYFRVEGEPVCIATSNKNIKENQTFLRFSEHFKKCNCPVPEIYGVSADESIDDWWYGLSGLFLRSRSRQAGASGDCNGTDACPRSGLPAR